MTVGGREVLLRGATGGPGRRAVVLATVTPLASIFGSGFLIIIPILERELGSLAAVGMAGVCLLAWMVGIAIRHNVAVVEPLSNEGRLGRGTVGGRSSAIRSRRRSSRR